MVDNFSPATAVAQGYAEGRLSPVDEVERALARAEETQPVLNTMCRIDHDSAREAAARSAQRWRDGAQLGPLDGIPVTIKDNVPIAGQVNRNGSLTTPETPAAVSAPAVDRLREAGAVLVGITTMPDWGCKGVGDSPIWGTTRNPWDPSLTPGGSSSGAAAGVAAGIVPMAIGTDGAGSIRMPASFCGLAGIKPTFGRVAVLPGSAFGTLSHQGPMARTVEDLALMLGVIARADERDPFSWAAPEIRRPDPATVRGLRVAVDLDWGPFALDPALRDALDRAAGWLGDAGAVVERVDVTGYGIDIDRARATLDVLWESGCAALVARCAPEKVEFFDDFIRQSAERSRHTTTDFIQAQSDRTDLAARFTALHRDWDVLLTPVTTTPAFEVDRDFPADAGMSSWLDWAPYMYPFNMTGFPALTVPAGLDERGRPLGVQLAGPKLSDQVLLDAAAVIESGSGGFAGLREQAR